MAPPTMERRQQAATDRPWNRPGKAPPTMLMRPTGGMMDDQVEFQDSVFWTPQVLDAVQDVIEEEALFYKPVHKSDKWDYIDMPRQLESAKVPSRTPKLSRGDRGPGVHEGHAGLERPGVASARADRQRLAAK